MAERRGRLRISARSAPLLAELHDYVVRYEIRGPIERFRDVASDCFDGSYFRSELDDLIRRRLLIVIRHGFDDGMGRDPLRDSDLRLCGVGWSVDPSERLIQVLWPDRIVHTTRRAAPGAVRSRATPGARRSGP